MLDALLQQVTPVPMEAVTSSSPVAGKSIVFTGSLERMTRDEAKRGRTSRRKSRGIGVEKNRPPRRRPCAGSKFAKAAELGVKTISEEDWLMLAGQKDKVKTPPHPEEQAKPASRRIKSDEAPSRSKRAPNHSMVSVAASGAESFIHRTAAEKLI